MALTFFVCFYKGIKDDGERLGLVILLIIVQYLCMIWFIICSVYFLKKIVLACLKGTCTNMCPTCAKGCKCVCDTLEDAKEGAATTAKKVTTVAKPKKEEPKSFFSFGNNKPAPMEEKRGFFSTKGGSANNV